MTVGVKVRCNEKRIGTDTTPIAIMKVAVIADSRGAHLQAHLERVDSIWECTVSVHPGCGLVQSVGDAQHVIVAVRPGIVVMSRHM